MMGPWFETNRALLSARHPELAAIERHPDESRFRLETTRTGPPTLIRQDKAGQISLHSRFDPIKEAADQVKGLTVGDRDILVIFGFALGYHLKAVRQVVSDQATVVVVEPDADLFAMALHHVDLSDVLDRPNLHFIVGRPEPDVLNRLRELREQHSWACWTCLEHPGAVGNRPEYFESLKNSIRTIFPEKTPPGIIRAGFRNQALTVLIMDSGYYLVRETTHAFTQLGHRPVRLPVPDARVGDRDMFRRLLDLVTDTKPDFLLTINHIGFDADGMMTDLLDRLNLPVASWFVDSPALILGDSRRNVSDICSIFVWDEDYVGEMKRLGFEHVHYLPLGTDETLFRPMNGRPNPLARLASPVSFVGSSMTETIGLRIRDLGLPTDLRLRLDEAAMDFMNAPDRTPAAVMARHGLTDHPYICALAPSHRLSLEVLVTWKATQLYRAEAVRALASLSPTVIGDAGWRVFLDPVRFRLEPGVDYYRQLPWVYPVSKINLNATSRQMKNGLNQRIFDVPATASFLLTDAVGQLDRHFDIGREAICYHGPDEALDLADYYLRHEAERQAIAERAYRRVLAAHTYRNRLLRLIRCMRDDHRG